MSRLVVRAHRPGRTGLLALLAAAAVALAVTLAFRYGQLQAQHHLAAARDTAQSLDQQLRAARGEAAGLQSRLTAVERTARLEGEAYRQLESTMAGLQMELLTLREELAFYKGIVSPEDGTRGLKVQRMKLAPDGAGGYGYKLVLTQVLDNGAAVSGSATLEVEGLAGGEPKTLASEEVLEGDGVLHFRFRYFQEFEGALTLPEGFEPQRIMVKVEPKGRKYKSFDETFDWPSGG